MNGWCWTRALYAIAVRSNRQSTMPTGRLNCKKSLVRWPHTFWGFEPGPQGERPNEHHLEVVEAIIRFLPQSTALVQRFEKTRLVVCWPNYGLCIHAGNGSWSMIMLKAVIAASGRKPFEIILPVHQLDSELRYRLQQFDLSQLVFSSSQLAQF